jgi:predicted Zn-dependent protease
VLKSALAAQRRSRAAELVKQLQTKKPAQALGWQMEGELGMAEGRFDAAATAFHKAHGKAATSESAWALYAALVATGKATEARQHADAWLQQHAADVAFLNRLGEAAQNRGDLAEAEARFRQALKSQPDSPMLMNNLAYLLIQKRDPAALDLALAASKAAPYSPPILDTLAQAYAARSDLKKALQWQSMSVAMSPRNPVYRINLVKLHLQAGEKKEAREELERMQSQWGTAPLPAEVAKLSLQARD